jgi:alpha-galactosidase
MLRRHFIKLSGTTFATVLFSRLSFANSLGTFINIPDQVWAQVGDQWIKLSPAGSSTFAHQDIQVRVASKNEGQAVYIQSPVSELQAIRFGWRYQSKAGSRVLGDHWERSYGDLAWKSTDSSERKPWYMLVHDEKQTACYGVKTGAKTICSWAITEDQVQLTMDTRSGAQGLKLGNRTLHAADIVTSTGKPEENPFHTATRFCKVMCEHPRLPKDPVYGINDWYAVYGNNSFESIKTQTELMATLMPETKNRPFSVIDDGWQQADDFSKANDKFKDMHKMADVIQHIGMRPGLWTRPLIARLDDKPSLLAPTIPGRNDSKAPILDPTVPENLERVKSNMALYKQWGYDMVKHDYSTYDIFGRWGFQMTDAFTAPGWHFYDRSKTNAEIILQLYETIRAGAGDMYVIGCNTMSHLSAGLFELNRTGDDTSGKEWSRTRKMGINTLAFRLPHHDTFYAADGDCVGLTKDVPWEKNRQWLQLLAESGAPLFVSAELDFIGPSQKAALKSAFAQAARRQPTAEPIDWMTDPWPEKWKLNGRLVTFDWGSEVKSSV